MPEDIQDDKSESKPTSWGAAISSTLFLFAALYAVTFLWNFYQSYGDQRDYVCFNHECDYIAARDYSVNWTGTCLYRTDPDAPSKQCGGSIEITKFSISFTDRLRVIKNKIDTTCPAGEHFDFNFNTCLF